MSAREKLNRRDSNSMIPGGQLCQLSTDQVKPSPHNPRKLFDPGPLKELRESIREHGVLVPIIAYKLPGQDKYAIVDGERRYRCCLDLEREGYTQKIPANIVGAPDKLAQLIYMFNIHSFREQWELMPTALGLKEVIDTLEVDDTEELKELTGLSTPQIERCKIILDFPQEFQKLSLESDPTKRIPSNFWIELHPVLDKAQEVLPDLTAELGRDGITKKLVSKYRGKKIKSVIHFRRIMEAFEVREGDTAGTEEVADRLREYILTTDLETREAFDEFIQDRRRAKRAMTACEEFISVVKRSKANFAIENRVELITKLNEVITFAQILIEQLEGEDPDPPSDSA